MVVDVFHGSLFFVAAHQAIGWSSGNVVLGLERDNQI